MKPTKLIRGNDGRHYVIYEHFCGMDSPEGGAVRDFLAVARDDKLPDLIDTIENWSEPFTSDEPTATRGAWWNRGGGYSECVSHDMGRLRREDGPIGVVIANSN